MSELPSGTVSLLFSDIEGSTLLLTRLGPTYTDALDGQRQVLRKAWAEHSGAEMGTEGDSFFVAFPTAEDAVAAAAQAQRGLAAFAWPAGEQVRVRIGIHTGTPTLHDGGYVGMDVHRAARIAGAAHGGQVVMSSATSELVSGCLPQRVKLRDLGRHQLKDITAPEHLFQLEVDGLPQDFPPLKTLGASSSLPKPATTLVGRDQEVAELEAALKTPPVRLVTLTGPGGSGKTRLAVGVAERLVAAFPDGVYFVPLAASTTADVMWTTIAEVLDVPLDGRTPPALFRYVAHRSALIVLDNLEQISGADAVVAELMEAANEVVVIATSRRPLHLAAEHEHAVPPLELPRQPNLAGVEESGAAQLFLLQARKVRSSFTLTEDNAADVAAVCRRLDGLPLAIELAAARSKMLSPRALLSRLNHALDIAAMGSRGPSRQQTLRHTIGWSYDLLSAEHKALFRRLGVFAGGTDMDGVAAIAAGETGLLDAELFDLVTELVDASLVTIDAAADGEPRIGLLQTVRSYAVDQLTETNELAPARERHAHHYLGVAEALRPLLDDSRLLEARHRFETDLDNFREAIGWALEPPEGSLSGDDAVRVGLRLCRALARFWDISGYFAEGCRYLQRAIDRAGASDSPELADCLNWMSIHLRNLGDLDRAHPAVTASVGMWRRLHDPAKLSMALETLARLEAYRGLPAAARSAYEEALTVARESADRAVLLHVLLHYALMEDSEHHHERSLVLNTEAFAVAAELDDRRAGLMARHNMACTLRKSGRAEAAKQQIRDLIPEILALNNVNLSMALAEDYGAALAEVGDYREAVRLLGAADVMRERLGAPRNPMQQAEIAEPMAKARSTLDAQEWEDAYQDGRDTSVEDALANSRGPSRPT